MPRFPRCHDSVAVAWWTNSSKSVYRELILPKAASTAVIENLGVNHTGVGHYVQVNLKASGNIVVQGETRSFSFSELAATSDEVLPVIGAKTDSDGLLSTPIIVLLAVLSVLTVMAIALLFFVRFRRRKSCAGKGKNERGQANGNNGVSNFGNGSVIEMYGEVTSAACRDPQQSEALLGGGPQQILQVPQWPEPPPQWPEPEPAEENSAFLAPGLRRSSKNSIGSSWSSLLNVITDHSVR